MLKGNCKHLTGDIQMLDWSDTLKNPSQCSRIINVEYCEKHWEKSTATQLWMNYPDWWGTRTKRCLYPSELMQRCAIAADEWMQLRLWWKRQAKHGCQSQCFWYLHANYPVENMRCGLALRRAATAGTCRDSSYCSSFSRARRGWWTSAFEIAERASSGMLIAVYVRDSMVILPMVNFLHTRKRERN